MCDVIKRRQLVKLFYKNKINWIVRNVMKETLLNQSLRYAELIFNVSALHGNKLTSNERILWKMLLTKVSNVFAIPLEHGNGSLTCMRLVQLLRKIIVSYENVKKYDNCHQSKELLVTWVVTYILGAIKKNMWHFLPQRQCNILQVLYFYTFIK